MFGKLLAAFAALPRVLGWIESAWSQIMQAWENWQETKRREEMAKAIEKAKREKNTCEMERMLDPSKRCDP